MVTRAEDRMLPRLKRMWQTCFNDTQEGTDFTFDRLLTPDQMLVWTGEDGRPAAMINWKLLRFTTPRGVLPGAYVFGVATLPEHRGKGISRALMRELHDLLAGEGLALSCLVPASSSLFDFYASQGFERHFSYQKITVEAGLLSDESRDGVLSPVTLQALEEMRNTAFGASSLFGAWDGGYLGYVDQECRFLGGDVLRFSCRGRTGYAVCCPAAEGTLLVREAVLDREDVGALLLALHQRYRARRYELRVPEDFPDRKWHRETLPFAMVKWYDEDKRTPVGAALGKAPWFAFGLDM